jgi:hypothetical protein
MIYKGDIGLYLSGGPVVVPMCGIYITQPKIKDICQFGEQKFFMALSLLIKTNQYTMEIKQGNSELKDMSDFQILMLMVEAQPLEIKPVLNTFFSLICPAYSVKYSKNAMEFFQENDNQEKKVGQVTAFNFEKMQLILKELFYTDDGSGSSDYNPSNEKAQEIMRKLQAGKEKIAQQRGTANTGTAFSIFALYASILSIGMNIDINIIYNYTPFQLYDAFKRYSSKTAEDFYRKVATTPLMDVSKMEEPDAWTRNLYSVVS